MADLGPFKALYDGPDLDEVFQVVIHSVESGMTPGIGESLMTGWWRNPANKSSVHGIADPRDYCSGVPTTVRAWHCGAGNTTSVGIEHAGRAAFSKEDWLTPAALKMLNNSARNTARIAKRHGIPLRWLSVAEVKANAKGFCTHNDMRLARGGTTHTDPGPNFPYDLYMQLVQQWAGEPVRDTGTNTENVTTPAGAGGAQQKDWFDMADKETLKEAMRELFEEGERTPRSFKAAILAANAVSATELGYAYATVAANSTSPEEFAESVRAIVEVLRTEGVSGAGDKEAFLRAVVENLGKA